MLIVKDFRTVHQSAEKNSSREEKKGDEKKKREEKEEQGQEENIMLGYTLETDEEKE